MQKSIFTIIIYVIFCSFNHACIASQSNDDIAKLYEQTKGTVIFDFEEGIAAGWQVESDDVNITVAENIKSVTTGIAKQGRYFLTTGGISGNDFKPKGMIKSPVFQLKDGLVTFLIGGGTGATRTKNYVALCMADGSELLRADSSGSDLMRRVEWDCRNYIGKKVFLRIVDDYDGDKGYISFDDFRQADYQQVTTLKKQMEEKRLQHKKALLEDKDLLALGSPEIYTGQNLTAIDFLIGGIGSGCIHMDGNAQRPVWEIFNQFSNQGIENTFFAIKAACDGDKAIVKALQTVDVGPFEAMKRLSLQGEYPFAWYKFQDESLSVDVNMEAFNFLIPFDVKNSATPCAIFNITVKNTSSKTVNASLLATQRNPACKQNVSSFKNQTLKKGQADVLYLDASGFGNMSLACLEPSKVIDYWKDLNSLYQNFSSSDKITAVKQSLDGAIISDIQLKPGQSKNVTFILTWYFPDACHGVQTGKNACWHLEGNMYTNWWKDSYDVFVYVKKNLEQLSDLTHLYHDTLYQSNLPYWLRNRLSSQLAVLKSKTLFWAKNGYIGGWEGTCSGEGCCMGNCTHVWHYAQAHARLFPEIGRKLQEIDFSMQQADGGIPHRQNNTVRPATDGMCGIILASYREYLTSTDQKWLDRQWPKIKKAMDYVIAKWDSNHDGVLSGPQWNTLDAASSGSSSWLGSLYLAALAASEKMAQIENQPAIAENYQKIKLAGQVRQNKTLFNGRYYYQLIDKKHPRQDYGTGCQIDQVLGQWWAWQVNLGNIYPADRVQKALSSLLEYNFHSDFYGRPQMPRKFVDEADAGMQMITWPDGDKPQKHVMNYDSEVMSGFEYSAAAAMIYSGLLKEGFTVLKAAHDRYDGCLRTNLNPSQYGPWGYSGNPFGDDECGKYYARSMSLWSVLLACQGFIYDGPKGKIGFAPNWKPDDHVTMFTVAQGYGLFTQKRNEKQQFEKIELKYGLLKLNLLEFALPKDRTPANVQVEFNGKKIASNYSTCENLLTITLPDSITLTPQDSMTVRFELK